MQPYPDVAQEDLQTYQLPGFLHGDELSLREFLPRRTELAGLGDPQQMVKVAQAAGEFLQVRLEVGILKAFVTLVLLELFRLAKYARIEVCPKCFLKGVK
jgi:hypothetical protein